MKLIRRIFRIVLVIFLMLYIVAAFHANKLVIYETAKHESICDKEPQKWRKEIHGFLLKGD